MYSDSWINKYSEKKIYEYLKNNGTINISSHNEEDTNFTTAIEHFLVKYKNSNDIYINKYIDSLFKAFYNNPLLYSYSYILSNELIVKSLINNNDNRKQLYIAGKNKLINGWEDTYNKLMNDEPVNITDKNKLHVLFTLGIRNGNTKYKKQIEEYIFKLLKDNKIPDNDFEKLLLFNYASRITLGNKYNMVDTFIKLGNLESKEAFRGGYQNNACIIMNDHPSITSFYKTLDQMIQCVCHETTHTIQEQQAINEPESIHGMEMAIQRLFGHKEYKTGDNYLFNEIEENAQRNGYSTASVIYGMADRYDIMNKLVQEKMNYIKNRRFQYEYVTINNNGKKEVISKEKFNVENTRRIIKENPNLIKEYPVLTNLFDNNGNYKSLETMLSEKFKSHDIREMYTDYIIYDIRHGGLDNINLNNKSDEYKYNVLNNLCNVFRTIINKTINVINDYEFRSYYINKTSFFYKIHLDDAMKLAEFIEKELPFMRDYEKKHNGNYALYGSYTTSLRSLLDNIEKAKHENKLSNLEEYTNTNKNRLNRLDLNIRNEYMDYILSFFSTKERNTKLKLKNRVVTLEHFVKVEVLNHMDRNHYLYNDNGKLIKDKSGYGIDPITFVKRILEKYKISEIDEIFTDDNNISNTYESSLTK